MMDSEIWKDIQGFEGVYQISTHGRVRSLTREVSFGVKRGSLSGKMLKLQRTGSRKNNIYLAAYLRTSNGRRILKVHRLVADAFIINKDPDNLILVNHLDKNTFNNHVSNLEWSSYRENNSHKNLGVTSSKYVGVSWDKTFQKWNAYIRINGKRKNLGYFRSEVEAAFAYRSALINNGLTNKYAYGD